MGYAISDVNAFEALGHGSEVRLAGTPGHTGGLRQSEALDRIVENEVVEGFQLPTLLSRGAGGILVPWPESNRFSTQLILKVYPDSLKIENSACGEAVLGFVCMDDSRWVFVAS